MGYHGSYDVIVILTLSGQRLELPAMVTRYDGIVLSKSDDEGAKATRTKVETARKEGNPTVTVKEIIFQSDQDEKDWKATRVQEPVRFHIL